VRNGVLKSMGLDEVPQPAQYRVQPSFEVTYEPNKETIERIRAERAAAELAGEPLPSGYDLTDAEMDAVTYQVFLAIRPGGVVMAGGLIPQAKIRGPEISRIPKLELLGRIEQAFASMKG